jgi:hypothetical protein
MWVHVLQNGRHMRRSLLPGLLFLALSAGTYGCSDADPAAPAASDAPADDQQEEELVAGVTRLASKLEDPRYLTTQGENVYFATTYGFATQEMAEYHHDVWVKSKDGRAKRLYKNLYGATWGMVATKNGLYEINEGYASVWRYPLDGSKPEGEGLVHAVFGNEEQPEVGIAKLAADDDGFVVALRTGDQPTDAGPIVAYTPAGKSEKKLGNVPGGATALTVAGSKVLVGTGAGDDTFFATATGLYVLRKGAPAAVSLLAEPVAELHVVRDALLYAQHEKGVSSVPLAGGAPRLVFKTKTPSDVLYANGALFVTDTSMGACRQTDEGQACSFDGSVFRVKY